MKRISFFSSLIAVVSFGICGQAFGQPNDMGSVSELTKFITERKAEKLKTSYYEALRERILIKAYPEDRVPVDQYQIASEKSRFLPPATFKPKGGVTESGEPKWEFVGPQGLGVPYTTYYGPSNSKLNGRIADLCYDPIDENTIYMAAPAGGIWKTTNNGTSWVSLGDQLLNPYVGIVRVHPKNRTLVFAGLGDRDGGTGTGNGLLRSDDSGASWVNIPLRSGSNATDILFNPEFPELVLASFSTGGGLFRSTNKGFSFTNVNINGNSFANVTDMSMGAKNVLGQRLYYARVRNAGLFVSADNGLTWTIINEPAGVSTSSRTMIDCSAVDPNRIYYIDNGQRLIFSGIKNGAAITWTDISSGFPNGNSSIGQTYNWSQSTYDQFINVAAAPNASGVLQDFVYVGLITVASWDGTTWRDIGVTYTSSAKTHNDQHCIAFFPGDNRKLALGNDGGVFPTVMTSPTASTAPSWNIGISANSTLGITMFYSSAYHPTDPTRMMGGTQDNASPVAMGNLSSWVNRTGGDGCGCAINPVNPLVQYGSAQYNGLYRTSNGWSTSTSFGPSWGSDSVPFVSRMAVDPTAPNPLYVATNYLWRYNPGTGTWDARLGGTILAPSGATVLSIAIAPSSASVLYAGTTSGDLWRSANAGATWTKLDDVSSPALPARAITSISVHPTNPQDILVTLSGSGVTHVYHIANTSLAVPIASAKGGNASGQLPDIQTNWITRDNLAPSTTWFVATDVGVFMTTDGGTVWKNAGLPLGLPMSEVSTVDWIPGTGYLQAATYGRGMWRLKVRDVGTETDTKLVFKASGSRYQGNYQVTFAVQNAGAAVANDIRITSASMKIGFGSTTLVSPLPIGLGSIGPNAGSRASILWSGTNQTDVSGTVTISGSYVVGSTNRTFSVTQSVSFP